jgi:hypothetical protein
MSKFSKISQVFGPKMIKNFPEKSLILTKVSFLNFCYCTLMATTFSERLAQKIVVYFEPMLYNTFIPNKKAVQFQNKIAHIV